MRPMKQTKTETAFFRTSKNQAMAFAILIMGIIGISLSVVVSIRFGAADLSYRDVLNALVAFEEDNQTHIIVRELRLPRAVAAILVGSSLAVSGAIMQGMTRNPLASPSIMGVTAGSSFLIAIAFALMPGISYSGLSAFSFIGAGFGAALVFGLTTLSRGGMTPVKLALAGSAITALLSSLSTAIGIKYNIAKDMSYFFAGGVSAVQPTQVQMLLPFVISGLLLAVILSRSITVLSLGEEVAKSLGQNTSVVQLMGTAAVLLLTGAAVSIAGMIGFVGLIVPHITRFLVGTDYRWLIPCSAVLGGILLIAADIVGRMVNAPFETPVGAITALVGVPFFIYLARKEGRA